MKKQKTFFFVLFFSVLLYPLLGQNAILSGNIETTNGDPINSVEVSLYDANGTLISSITTNTSGQYAFNNLVQGDTYQLAFTKDDDPLNGVSTFDMVLIARHILGITLLDTPEKLLAADVNISNSNTTLDLVLIRRLILFIDQSFPVLASWRFISADLDLTQPSPSLNTENRIEVTLNSATVVQDIKGIKLGDVNYSAVP